MSIVMDRTPLEAIDGAVREACARGDFVSVETIMRYALKECEDAGELDEGLISRLHNLADSHLRHDRFHEAKRLVRLGLKSREAILGRQHPDVIDSRRKLEIIAGQSNGSGQNLSILARTPSLRDR